MHCDLVEPRSLEEAVENLSNYAPDGMPVAGGQSLLVMLRNRMIAPKALVSLEHLEGFREIRSAPDRRLSIGAMVTCSMLMRAREIGDGAPVLAEAAGKVGSTAIRNLGTIGGNISHNELGADLPPALLVLNADAECRSLMGSRRIPLGEFFRDYFTTSLEQGEVLCRVHVPVLPPRAQGLYVKRDHHC